MSQDIDNESLAALIDGKLSAAERARLLAKLADSDRDTLGTLADAVALLDTSDLGAAIPQPTATPHTVKRPRFRVGLGMAAAGFIIVLALEFVGRSLHSRDRSMAAKDGNPPTAVRADVDYKTDFVALLAAFAVPPKQAPSLGSGGAFHGEQVAGPNAARARAVELRAPGARASTPPAIDTIAMVVGGLLTDLRLSSRGTGSLEVSAGRLAVMLGGLGQEHASALFDTIARAPAGSKQTGDSAIKQAIESVRPIGQSADALTAGAWLEAARFAAGTKDTVFFIRTWPLVNHISALTARDSGSVGEQVVRLRTWAFQRTPVLNASTPKGIEPRHRIP